MCVKKRKNHYIIEGNWRSQEHKGGKEEEMRRRGVLREGENRKMCGQLVIGS